jgi:hypothetical protein
MNDKKSEQIKREYLTRCERLRVSPLSPQGRRILRELMEAYRSNARAVMTRAR